jgi:cellulose synthase operon protein C
MSQKQKGNSIPLPCLGGREKGLNEKAVFLFPFSLVLCTCLVSLQPLLNISPAQAQRASSGATQRGFNLLRKKWFRDAIKAFQQAVRQQPQSLSARLGLAQAYQGQGEFENAWNAYQKVLELDSNNQEALRAIGVLGGFRPQWQKPAIQALSTLLNINSNDLQARAQRALLYYYQGRASESIADYQIVLARNPQPKVLLEAAEAYTNTGNVQQGLQLFNRYRSTGGTITGNAAVAYGRALRRTGNARGAIEVLEAQLRRSAAVDFTGINARSELAVAYLDNRQEAQALGVLDPLSGKTEAILPLARALNEIRKRTGNNSLVQRVDALYRQALAQNPNPSSSFLKELADVYSGLPGGKQNALQLYRRAATQLPNDKGLALRLLALENQLGLVKKNDLNTRLAALVQTLPSDRMQLQQLADALKEIDNPDPQFLPIYQNLVQTKEGASVTFLYYRLAQMYLQRDDTASARSALATYTSTPAGSKDMASQLLAATIEQREGNLDASAQRFLAVLNSRPNNELADGALRGLAGVRLQQRRFDDVLAIYDQLLARNPQNLNLRLAQTTVAYQAKRISQAQAETVLNNWLETQRADNDPKELYDLVGALPPSPQRLPLYNYLTQRDPSNIPVQARLVQVIAARNPAQAQMLVRQLLARLPNNSNSMELQGQLAVAIEDWDLASKSYENVLAQQPDNLDALKTLGFVRFRQREFKKAEKIYEQVLAIKPEDRDARQALAGLKAIGDQPLTALVQLQELQQVQQVQQNAQGVSDTPISCQARQIQEDFLLRRGFQPSWENNKPEDGPCS